MQFRGSGVSSQKDSWKYKVEEIGFEDDPREGRFTKYKTQFEVENYTPDLSRSTTRVSFQKQTIEKDTSSYHDMIYKRISTSSDTPKRIANIKLNRASGSICDCCRSCVVM
jgi:hypothetical protein